MINRSTPEPTTRVSQPKHFEGGFREEATMASEWVEAIRGPGKAFNLNSGKRLSDVRDQLDLGVNHVGIHFQKGGKPTIQDVPNPDAPDGKWNPYDFMPRFAFEPDEDAFPISPTFDGDTNLGDNGAREAMGDDEYDDGVIGGRQSLSSGFNVAKKGEYTVLSYSFYYATNKAVHYHAGDYSHAQVYLKPGKDGKLEPQFLATSWHHGSVLTPWEDLAKDDAGRPIVKVHQGSHALQPLGKGDEPPEGGLQIGGDGMASQDGKPLPHQLTFDAFQPSVGNATLLDADTRAGLLRLDSMRWGDAGLNPFLPEVYDEATNPWKELATRALGGAKDKVEDGVDAVKDRVEDAAGGVKKWFGKLF